MSTDSVDDLHAAEDMAGTAVKALAELVAGLSGEMSWEEEHAWDEVAAFANARVIVSSWDAYCRPTCCYLDNADEPEDERCYSGGEEDGCGCPCDHTDLENVDG